MVDVTQMEVEDSVEMAHDTSELQVAEDQGKDTGSSVTDPYACSVCEMTFSSVMEHIKEYHQGQEESITVMEDETQMSKNCDLQEEFGDSSKELCSAVSKMNTKPLGCLKQQNRVVAEKHKQISHPKPVQNMSGLKCVSKEVKIDKFWENQPVEKHGGKIIGKPGKGGMFEVLKKEVRRFPLKKDPRSSIEKLFSGNCVLKNSGPDSKPKTYYIGGNGVPELKVFMSPDQEGSQTTISVYVCSSCRREFGSVSTFEKHDCRKAKASPMACKFCNAVFADLKSMKLHTKAVHNTKSEMRTYSSKLLPQPVKCGSCENTFMTMRALKLHEKIHLAPAELLECPVCRNKCSSNRTLKQHMTVHSDAMPKKKDVCLNINSEQTSNIDLLVCPFCPKKFNTLVQLSGHKKSHTKPYLCDECNRPFSSLFAVKKHMTSHDEANSGKDRLRFQCHICGASYARRFALRDHLKGHDISSEPTEKECCDDSSNDLT
ncbi:hypothetical protein C0J52_13721 [Blattella germanica]|nr:hypothetical protein C0J52_13721 [Blattella germanica]